jgi:hypothetical protein
MIEQARDAIPLGMHWKAKYRATRTVCGALSRLPDFPQRFGRLETKLGGKSAWLDSVIYRAKRWTYCEKTSRDNFGRANGDGSEGTDFGSGYGYIDEVEDRRIALFYKRESESGQYSARETPVLNAHLIATLNEVIASEGIRRVVNFGCCYAYVDAELAAKHPEVQFVAIDRSPAVKTINEESFSLPNLTFVAGDALPWIEAQPTLADTLIVHTRTMTLLPKSFVSSFYRALTVRRIAAVCGFETYGFSREINDWYEQDERDKSSVLYRDTMYLHNYVGIFAALGYHVTRLQYLKTPHVDADYRVQSFTALPRR